MASTRGTSENSSQVIKTPSRKRLYYCGHCDEEVSKTLFFQNKRQYYDQNRQEWERFSAQSSVMKDDDSIPVDFKFSSSSESISESG